MTVTLTNEVVEALVAAAEADELTADMQAALTEATAALALSGGESSRLLEWGTLRSPLRELMRHDERARSAGPTQADFVGPTLEESIVRNHGVSFDDQPVAAGGIMALSLAIRFSDRMLALGKCSEVHHRYVVSTLNPVLVAIGRHAPDGLFE